MAFAMLIVGLSGCEGGGGMAERFGKTFYLDGAGNWGFGASEVPSGLKSAGYRGDVELYVWTTSFTPIFDQINRPAAHLRAAQLADKINHYHARYPENKINVIALSAGTGVAIWAVENLKEDTQINNLILLGSSLSANYDSRKALKHMTGKIYVYYSHEDAVLDGAVKVVGTIDGAIGADSAGLVGLKPPPGMEDRIVNIGWSSRWLALGWAGGHTDGTNELFVRREIATHIVEGEPTRTAGTEPDRQRLARRSR
jgi:hypothetical protein